MLGRSDDGRSDGGLGHQPGKGDARRGVRCRGVVAQLAGELGHQLHRHVVDQALDAGVDHRHLLGQGAYLASETVDSHVVWDMMASWQFTENLSTYLKVDNLLDETYVAARRPAGLRPGLPRTAYLGIRYQL